MSENNTPKGNKKNIENNQESNKESQIEESSNNERCGEINSKIKKYNDILAIDIDNGKYGDKVTKNDIKRNNPVYGYYVRKPVWVYFESGGDFEYDSNIFVILVFLIVLTMLIVTGGFVLMVINNDDLNDFFHDLPFMVLLMVFGVMIGLSYAMAFVPWTRVMPCNIICLIIAVICMSIIVAYISVRYDTDILMYAFFATSFVVFCCILLAITPIDFTKWYLYVIVISYALLAVILIVGLARMITGEAMTMTRLILLIIMTIVHSIILVMELQMILGGGAIEMDENDYALGAYLIYTSVINMFLQIVKIFGLFDEMS